MNPISLIKAAPWVIAAVLVILLGVMTNRYLGKRDELSVMTTRYNAFVGATEVIGKQAEEDKKAQETEHEQNLTQVKANHEEQIPQIRADAVTNYIATHPASVQHRTSTSTGSGYVRGNGSGVRLDDGVSKECIPDEGFIQDAAEDAAKVAAWI